MARTYPLTVAQFFAGIPITSFTFSLGEALESGETGGGEILTASVGNRLWKIDVDVAPLYYNQMEQIKADFDTLRYPGRSLIVPAMPLQYPQYDPTGAVLGSSAVTLNAVAGNNRELKLAGLPAGYVITRGDMLSFQYGSNPVRYALHQIVVGGVANGSGITDYLEVSSFIRTGWVLNQSVKLAKPEVKAVYVPKSFNPGKSKGMFTDGVSFSLTQTFR